MLIIAIYWIFLSVLFIPLGVLTGHILRIELKDITIALILGLISGTALFSVFAFFMPLGLLSLSTTTAIALLAAYKYREECRHYIADGFINFKRLPEYQKVCLALLLAGSLLKSAGSPFITDNESYYIQTIKWLNEFGFVKGLANLHIFFAQTSAWHVLQAGVNFGFITNRINDINGFVFIWVIFYFFSESCKNQAAGWLKYFTVFSVLLFQFIDSPSPDFPLLLFLPVIIYITTCKKHSQGEIAIAVLLFVFLCTIKITIVPLGLLFIKNLLTSSTWKILLKGALPLTLLWLAKNILISGYPMYPLPYLQCEANWTVNAEMYHYIVTLTSDYGYFKLFNHPENLSLPGKLTYWISLPAIDGFFNKAAVMLFIITPVVIYLRKDRLYLPYIALLINFIAVLCTAPQFRYYLPQLVILACYLIAALMSLFKNRNPAAALIVISCMAVYIPFFNINLSSLSNNPLHSSTGHVALSQMYLPEKNTRFKDMKYLKSKKGNLNFFQDSKS